jgi:hypothetical protein
MINKIKCGECGKFIAHNCLEECKYIFTPDSDYSVEECYYLCVKCSKED